METREQPKQSEKESNLNMTKPKPKKSTQAGPYCTTFCCFIFLCLLQVLIPKAVRAEIEKPGILKARSFLPPEVLKGEHYKVDDKVRNDGFLNHYGVNSSFGNFEVTGTSSLLILVREIEAIAAMKKIKTGDTAIESLKQSGKNTVTGVKNLVSDPKGTLESAVGGLGSLFNRAVGTVGKRETTGAEDNKAAQLIGFSKSKGQIATKFGVNVYSRNKVLQTELDRLAWADYLGGTRCGLGDRRRTGRRRYVIDNLRHCSAPESSH